MTKAAFEAAQRPRSASASKRTGKGGGKGKPGPTQPRKRTVPYYCNKFLKDGTCPNENCKYPHLTKAEYDEALAKMKAADAAEAGK